MIYDDLVLNDLDWTIYTPKLAQSAPHLTVSEASTSHLRLSPGWSRWKESGLKNAHSSDITLRNITPV